MMSSWFTNVQLGFDMATSLTIVGAAVTWAVRQKRQTEAEKVRGINQQVRSTSLQKVQHVLIEMEDRFSVLIAESQKFENMIDHRVSKVEGEMDYSSLNSAIKTNSDFITNAIDRLGNIREEIGSFYESIQVRRYSLIPLLDAIDDGDKYIGVFQKNIDEVGEAYNSVSSGNVRLLKELEKVVAAINVEYGDDLKDLEEEQLHALIKQVSSDDKMMRSIKSIVFDEDYFYWVQRFVPAGKEQDFLDKVVKPSKIEDQDLCASVIINFILSLLRKQHELISQVLNTASHTVMKARIECKDILISLSAISHKLVMDNNHESLNSVIEKYETEEYFGRDTKIR